MNHANILNTVSAPSIDDQPVTAANPKADLPVLSDLELLLCGGGEGNVCW